MLRKLTAIVLPLAALTAQAGELYTIRTNDDMLRALDTETLQFRDIGPVGVPFDFGGLAWDGERMYMVQGFAGTNLYHLDLEGGAATLIGSHGFNDMFGLAYDPTTDRLYSGRSTRGRGFYYLDREDGTATAVGGDPGINLDGLNYDSARDQVVGGNAGPGDLYVMDREGAPPTLIYSGDFFNNCGLAYDSDTDLYWMIDWSGNLYTFDPSKAYMRTLVMSGLGAHDGLEYISDGSGCDPCDANCDGVIDAFDVEPFISVLLGGPGCASCTGDTNGDGAVDAFDIEPFIRCLVP